MDTCPIGFGIRFDDYLEELEIYSRSQNSEFSSDITLEMHGKPAVLGPTITSHVHSSFSSRDHRMINPAGNSNHPRFDSLESVVHHSGHAERHQHYPVMNGIPLQRDSLGMSRSRSPSTCATKSDALVGRVVQRSLRPTPPMNTSPWINAKYEQVTKMNKNTRNRAVVSHLHLCTVHKTAFSNKGDALC